MPIIINSCDLYQTLLIVNYLCNIVKARKGKIVANCKFMWEWWIVSAILVWSNAHDHEKTKSIMSPLIFEQTKGSLIPHMKQKFVYATVIASVAVTENAFH